MNKDKQYFYLYKITNLINNKIYIGIHATNNINDRYMGSGKAIRLAIKKYGIENFKKEILSFHNTYEEVYLAEQAIVTPEFVSSNSNYNIAIGGHGGNTQTYNSPERSKKLSQNQKGRKMVIDKNTGNHYSLYENDPRFETMELLGQTYKKCVYMDKDGNRIYTNSDDPRVLSGELVGVNKGKALYKDKDGNKIWADTNDPRVLSGELVGHTTGCKQSAESNMKRSLTQKGIPKIHPLFKCPVCGKITNKGNLMRWHKQCKEKFENEHSERYSLNLEEIPRN